MRSSRSSGPPAMWWSRPLARVTTSGRAAATRGPVTSSSPAGSPLGPPQVSALAAAGVAVVRCGLRPRVAVLATGSELRAPGTPLAPGEIYESNSVLIAAQLASAGAVATVFPVVADDETATRAALEGALEQDMLITSGGVSVGPHDLVRATLAELGAEEIFWRVAVKPGKPIAFAVRGASLVFGLPGNPVSSLVGFELFVRPALRALQGARDPGPEFLPGRLAAAVRRTADRDELVRAHRTGDLLAPLDGQDSHMIVRAAGRKRARPRSPRRWRAAGGCRGRVPADLTVSRLQAAALCAAAPAQRAPHGARAPATAHAPGAGRRAGTGHSGPPSRRRAAPHTLRRTA